MFESGSSEKPSATLKIAAFQQTLSEIDDPATAQRRMRAFALNLSLRGNARGTACHYLKGIVGLIVTGGAIGGAALMLNKAHREEKAAGYIAGTCILAFFALTVMFYTLRHFYKGKAQRENMPLQFYDASVNDDFSYGRF